MSQLGCSRAQFFFHFFSLIVLEALSRKIREGFLLELLYADDLVLIAETKELLLPPKVTPLEGGDGKEGSESECWKDKSHVVRASMWCLQEWSWRQLNLMRGVFWVGSQEM